MNCSVSRTEFSQKKKIFSRRETTIINSANRNNYRIMYSFVYIFYLLYVRDVSEYVAEWNSSVRFGARNIRRKNFCHPKPSREVSSR